MESPRAAEQRAEMKRAIDAKLQAMPPPQRIEPTDAFSGASVSAAARLLTKGGGPACGVRYLCQVPDGAVKEEAAEGERGAARLPQPLSNGAPPGEAACSASLAVAGPAAGAIAATDAAGGGPALHRPRQCYTCKARFVALHHFYASLCPKCAALNFRMRHAA